MGTATAAKVPWGCVTWMPEGLCFQNEKVQVEDLETLDFGFFGLIKLSPSPPSHGDKEADQTALGL